MKKLLVLLLSVFALTAFVSCDEDALKDLLNGNLTDAEIVSGLKEALRVGTDSTTVQLNRSNGYFQNELIKLLWPPEAIGAKNTIESLPGGKAIVDDFILKMNRAAEDAAKKANPIFVSAITNMTVSDGLNILQGQDTAATHYLRGQTFFNLRDLYLPDIKNSMESVGAQQAWQTVASRYNSIPFVNPVNEDISMYVTTRALDGLFVVVGQKERDIRTNVSARVTDILRKVFGSPEAQGQN